MREKEADPTGLRAWGGCRGQGEGGENFAGIATVVIVSHPIREHFIFFLCNCHSRTFHNFLHRGLTFLLFIPIHN